MHEVLGEEDGGRIAVPEIGCRLGGREMMTKTDVERARDSALRIGRIDVFRICKTALM